ncbi:MAG: hypothetical protein ACE5LB_04510, partial [Acidiferrobacterales bacterium]
MSTIFLRVCRKVLQWVGSGQGILRAAGARAKPNWDGQGSLKERQQRVGRLCTHERRSAVTTQKADDGSPIPLSGPAALLCAEFTLFLQLGRNTRTILPTLLALFVE